MKLFISGGGTAGHINPALAIAAEIEKRQKDIEVYYVGTPKGMENTLVTKYPMFHIQIQGIKRSLSLENIKTAYYTATSFYKARKLIKREKPDLVVGTGGYACWLTLHPRKIYNRSYPLSSSLGFVPEDC